MKATIYLATILLLGFSSCKKDMNTTKTANLSFIDTISVKRYYAKDILQPQFTSLYNKWKLIEISGGFSGGLHNLNFNYLTFKQNGIYCITRNDTAIAFGQINVINIYNGLTISFTPDKLSSPFFSSFQKQADLSRQDTLLLSDPCCDLYNYKFVKQ